MAALISCFGERKHNAVRVHAQQGSSKAEMAAAIL